MNEKLIFNEYIPAGLKRNPVSTALTTPRKQNISEKQLSYQLLCREKQVESFRLSSWSQVIKVLSVHLLGFGQCILLLHRSYQSLSIRVGMEHTARKSSAEHQPEGLRCQISKLILSDTVQLE